MKKIVVLSIGLVLIAASCNKQAALLPIQQPRIAGIQSPVSTETQAPTPAPVPVVPKASQIKAANLVVPKTETEQDAQIDANTIKNVEQDSRLDNLDTKVSNLPAPTPTPTPVPPPIIQPPVPPPAPVVQHDYENAWTDSNVAGLFINPDKTSVIIQDGGGGQGGMNNAANVVYNGQIILDGITGKNAIPIITPDGTYDIHTRGWTQIDNLAPNTVYSFDIVSPTNITTVYFRTLTQ